MHLWQWLRNLWPRSPLNVRVVLTDGRVLPVRCVYLGRGGAGQRIWAAMAPPSATVARLEFDQLPANTEIRLASMAPADDPPL